MLLALINVYDSNFDIVIFEIRFTSTLLDINYRTLI